MITAQNFSGFMVFVFLLTVPLAIVIPPLYPRSVNCAMMTRSEAPEWAFDVPPPDHPNHSTLQFDLAPLPRRPQYRLAPAGRYLLAGAAYAIVLVVVMFQLNDIAFLPVRFGVVVAVFAFTAFVLALHLIGRPWYLRFLTVFFGVVWVWPPRRDHRDPARGEDDAGRGLRGAQLHPSPT